MRKTVAVLALMLVAALGAFVPASAAGYVSDAKVVIIVGAVHGATDTYRNRGDAAYEEAIKYTPNVVKVYSPNATWKKVKAATAGANIVIYMGHGNGWPSPYTYDPAYTTKDGFGLNKTAGDGDHNNKYYGEPYVETLDLAPNAIVLLHHLCYASGNSEPGDPEPTVTKAKKRVQNYAAGFLRSPAVAVIADGHRGAGDYLRALFTTNQTIVSMWRSMPNYNGNEFSFASGRNSGYTAYMDPDSPTKGFYRSLVTKPTVTTSQVTGAVGDTGGDPSSFSVPGRAEVTAAGAELLPKAGGSSTTLPAGTRLAVVANPVTTSSDGTSLLEVAGLDDPSITGYVRTTQMVPRDSTAPVVVSAAVSAGTFSPNGDGQLDSTTVTAAFSESVSWKVSFKDGDGAVLASTSGSGKDAVATWDGMASGDAVGSGTYEYVVEATDAWKNVATRKSGSVKVDLKAPTMSGLPGAGDPVPWFAPNGDGFRETVTVRGQVSESGRLSMRVKNEAGDTVRTESIAVSAGSFAVTWDGRTDGGTVAPDGNYAIHLQPRDAFHNWGADGAAPARLVTVLGSVRSSRPLLYPQDRDNLVSTTSLSFALDREATVTWTIRNASGATVATLVDGATLPAGTHSRTFNGRTPSGAMLPTGTYQSVVTATDGMLGATQATSFEMNAFSVKVSDTTPKRGRKLTVTVVSAEPLDAKPRLRVKQPGKAAYQLKMSKVATRTYRVTFRIRTGGSKGTMTLRTQAPDRNGATNRTYLRLKLS